MEKINLLCVPYAGGSAMMYRSWAKELHPSIELHPVEIAGRGKRWGEPFYSTVDEACSDLLLRVKALLYKDKYALFGHSMGGILIYELIHKIQNANLPGPEHVFFSGCHPPHANPQEYNHYGETSDRDLESVLEPERMMEDAFLEDLDLSEKLRSAFLPIVRADVRMIEAYQYKPGQPKIQCNMTILSERYDDSPDASSLLEWREHAAQTCSYFEFSGGHFFIHEDRKKVITLINRILCEDDAT